MDVVQSWSPSVAVVAEDFESWRNIVSQSFVPLHVTSDHVDNFSARIRSRALGDVFISEIGANSHQVERTPALIARGDKKYFKLSLQLSGVGLLMQDNREAVLQAGDLAIYDTDRPYTLAFHKDFRSLVVMFPQSMIDLPREVIGQLTATRIAGDEGLARMVGPFLRHLTQNMDRLSGHSGLRMMHNTLDLVTTVLHSQLDVREQDRGPSRRASVLQEIRVYIDENLADPSLNPNGIAAANFISTRHLHGLFQGQGATVSTWIRTRRLEHCRRDLTDPLLASAPVSVVAGRWGFVDASHFSRLFRSTFGEAPSDYRARAMAL